MYEHSDKFGLPQYAAITMAATGSSTLVDAPGAGMAIAVDGLAVFITTDTAGKHDTSFFAETVTTGLMFRSLSNLTTSASPLMVDLETPWLLETNSALKCHLSITAQSTPGVHVSARYRIVRR